MKKLFTILLVVLMAVSLCACQKQQQGGNSKIVTELKEPVTITVWNTYTAHQQEAFQAMVDGFNASQDMITVKYEVQAYADFDSNLIQAVRNGTGPNIAPRYCSTAAGYADEGLLVNLYDYISNKKVGIENYKDNLVGKEYEEITQWGEDKIYVYPVIITSEVLYYNKTLFNELGLEAPKTWEELTEACKKIYAEKNIPGWGSDSETDTMIDRVIQLGSGYINGTTGDLEVDEAKVSEVLSWYVEGVQEGYFRLAGTDYYHSGPFTQGNVASYIGSSAGAGHVLPYADFEVGVTVIPQSGNEVFAPAWGGGLVVFDKTAEENYASYCFLKYLLNDDVLAEWAIEFGAMPATKTALNTEKFQKHASTNVVAQALIETAPCINWVESVDGADDVRNAFGKAVDSCCADDSGTEFATLIKNAVDTFFKEAKAALGK